MTQLGDVYRGTKPTSPEERMLDAINSADVNVVLKLLDEGFMVETPLKNSRTALEQATTQQHLGIMRILLERGASPAASLEIAKQNGFLRGWLLLDPEKQRSERVELLKFVQRRSSQKVDELLKNGVDPNFHDDQGKTPLGLAIELSVKFPGSRNVVEVLAKWQDPWKLSSTDINLHTHQGRLPLLLAKELNLPEIIELLKSLGAKEES